MRGKKEIRNYATVTAAVRLRFVGQKTQLTVAVGRNARLECGLEASMDYKMAWIHKGPVRCAVLATGALVVTKNPRISASREGPTFVLSIDNVSEMDSGDYLCQLNTKPTLTHTLVLDVVVPPVIVDGNSSRDVTADEGKDVTLTCDARGRPTPSIRWVREDGGKIPSGGTEAGEIGGKIPSGGTEAGEIGGKIPSGGTEAGEIGGKIPSGGTEADEWVGPKLRLGPLQRSAAGAFLCIASNGVPPTVSKRVLLSVNCECSSTTITGSCSA
ncbi:Immunoglobulin V-set domain [Trinorchestia longiramus]|nr:Immunoglobulin V-set domain [Trinorchestia longiramus]